MQGERSGYWDPFGAQYPATSVGRSTRVSRNPVSHSIVDENLTDAAGIFYEVDFVEDLLQTVVRFDRCESLRGLRTDAR